MLSWGYLQIFNTAILGANLMDLFKHVIVDVYGTSVEISGYACDESKEQTSRGHYIDSELETSEFSRSNFSGT
jgi:hypothetical protein